MKATLKLTHVVAMLALATASSAFAQEIGVGLKFGAGAMVNDSGDQHARSNINLALVGDYKLDAKSCLIGELRYRSFRAADHEVTHFGSGYTTNGVPVAGSATTGILMASSVDVRRDRVDGLGLAFGYRRAFLVEGLSWQGGLSIDSMKSTQEVKGSITVVATAPVVSTREGLSYTPSKNSVKPGAFLGLHWRADNGFFLESNAALVSFKQINYLPMSYTGNPATTETKNVNKVVLELNAGFRF